MEKNLSQVFEEGKIEIQRYTEEKVNAVRKDFMDNIEETKNQIEDKIYDRIENSEKI